jgi:hypothetical protein
VNHKEGSESTKKAIEVLPQLFPSSCRVDQNALRMRTRVFHRILFGCPTDADADTSTPGSFCLELLFHVKQERDWRKLLKAGIKDSTAETVTNLPLVVV